MTQFKLSDKKRMYSDIDGVHWDYKEEDVAKAVELLKDAIQLMDMKEGSYVEVMDKIDEVFGDLEPSLEKKPREEN